MHDEIYCVMMLAAIAMLTTCTIDGMRRLRELRSLNADIARFIDDARSSPNATARDAI